MIYTKSLRRTFLNFGKSFQGLFLKKGAVFYCVLLYAVHIENSAAIAKIKFLLILPESTVEDLTCNRKECMAFKVSKKLQQQ